jgi:hypothetical protein
MQLAREPYNVYICISTIYIIREYMPDKYKHTFAELNSLRNHLKWILACNNERELMQILRKYGIKDEDPRFAEIVKLFRDLRSGKT